MALGAGAIIGDDFLTPVPREPKALGAPRPHPYPRIAPFALPPHFVAPRLERVTLPRGTLGELPGEGNFLALTVDDGTSSEVVAAYARFAQDTGMRITFFLNGCNPAWTENAAVLQPLVNNGQIQLANHTWSHQALTTISDAEIVDEFSRNDDFIRSTFGVEAKPYFRPPFGYHDDRVDAIAADIGYTKPVMWYGTLADSSEIPDAQLISFAETWFLPQHIVIGHANFLPVTRVYDRLVEIIRERALIPVTLDDVFLRP